VSWSFDIGGGAIKDRGHRARSAPRVGRGVVTHFENATKSLRGETQLRIHGQSRAPEAHHHHHKPGNGSYRRPGDKG
jgi:hypothetical protein